MQKTKSVNFRNFFLVAAVSFLCSCSFNHNNHTAGPSFLQGKWSEDSVENKAELVSYEQNYFTFKCDSFYLVIKTHSKVNLQGGACYDAKEWQEYAKGYYRVIGDTLRVDGNFVDEHYRYKAETSCYRNGKYEEDFIIQQKGQDTIQLKSLKTSLNHLLVLKEKLTCK